MIANLLRSIYELWTYKNNEVDGLQPQKYFYVYI